MWPPLSSKLILLMWCLTRTSKVAKKTHHCCATALTWLIMLFQLRFIWEQLKIQLVGIMRVCVGDQIQGCCGALSTNLEDSQFISIMQDVTYTLQKTSSVLFYSTHLEAEHTDDSWSLCHYYYYNCRYCGYHTFPFLSTAYSSDKLNTILFRLTGCVPSWQELTILGSYGLWQQENWNGGG